MDRDFRYFQFYVIHSNSVSENGFCQVRVARILVTDNGTCFVSEEFEEFMLANGIRHDTSAPYRPASNGLAERAVQIVKHGLTQVDIHTRIAKVLFSYRISPQSTTGMSLTELLLGRRVRSKLE